MIKPGKSLTSVLPQLPAIRTELENEVMSGLATILPELREQTIPSTVTEMGYSDHPLVPPAMARVGYDPTKLLAAMQKDCLEDGYPNGYSFSGVLRVFPAWPQNRNASFGNLRAYGAFLVSSTLKEGGSAI